VSTIGSRSGIHSSPVGRHSVGNSEALPGPVG
jgi:hypothetical protein